MKTFILSATIAILFLSCKTSAHFESPNNLRYLTGVLYLNNGQTLEGKITVRKGIGKDVFIHVQGEKKPQRYDILEVDGFEIRNQYYELKQIKGGVVYNQVARYNFMKRLTPASSRIQLYEYLDKETTTVGDQSVASFETRYYIQPASEKGDGVWAVGSAKFVPHFDEKMSKLVEDCPSLAKKIADKEPGYFYAHISLSKERRADILWNIISEYNKCR